MENPWYARSIRPMLRSKKDNFIMSPRPSRSRRALHLALGLCLLVLPVCLLGGPPASAGPRTSIVIPFTPMNGHGGPLVQVRLNDRETATFLLDTGADGCVISDTLARKLGAPQAPVRGRFGVELVNEAGKRIQFVTIKKFQMGGGVFKDGSFIVMDHRDLFKLSEQGLDGLIGATLLEQFALLVDGPQHRLALISPGGLSDEDVRFMGFGGCPPLKLKSADNFFFQDAYSRDASFLVSLDLHNGSKKSRQDIIVDTGASDTSLSFGMARDLGLIATDKGGAQTLYGSYLSDIARVGTFNLGLLSLPNFTVSYPSMDEALLPPLLGEDVLASCICVFDFPKNKLYLKPVLPPLAPASGPLDKDHVDMGRLREAAHVPYPAYEKAWGSASSLEAVDTPARMAEKQKGLKGDNGDAEAYVKIGEMYDDDRQPAKARAAFEKAAGCYQARVKAAPKDAALLAKMAEALCRDGHMPEAEAAARSATVLAPQEPKAWIALGRVLHAESLHRLTGQDRAADIRDDFTEYQVLVARLLKDRPTPAAIADAKALAVQARAAFGKAVAVSPTDAAASQARADFLESGGLGLASPLRELRGERFNVLREMYPDAYFADVEQVARLKPDDPEALRDGAALDADIPASRGEKGMDDRETKFFHSLPRLYREAAQAKMDRLAVLGKSADAAKAAPALEALGEVQHVVLRDDVLAEATLRQALARDPARPRAVYVLARILTNDRRYADLEALLMDQLTRADTVQDRLLLARTLDKEGQAEEAQAQAQAAWKLRPDDSETNLCLAAVLLRRSGDDPLRLGQAGERLRAAASALGAHPGRAAAARYAVLQSIYLGLSGDPDAAEKEVLQVLDKNRTNTDARDVLAALVL